MFFLYDILQYLCLLVPCGKKEDYQLSALLFERRYFREQALSSELYGIASGAVLS